MRQTVFSAMPEPNLGLDSTTSSIMKICVTPRPNSGHPGQCERRWWKHTLALVIMALRASPGAYAILGLRRKGVAA